MVYETIFRGEEVFAPLHCWLHFKGTFLAGSLLILLPRLEANTNNAIELQANINKMNADFFIGMGGSFFGKTKIKIKSYRFK
jgi:hypothetical protein